MPDLWVLRGAPRLQYRLYHVQRRRQARCCTSSHTSSQAVRPGIVAARRVDKLRYRLVRHELQRGEGDGHAKCGRVRDVERREAFLAEDSPDAVAERLVGRMLHLHPLLDN